MSSVTLGLTWTFDHANGDSTFWSKTISLYGNSDNKMSRGEE